MNRRNFLYNSKKVQTFDLVDNHNHHLFIGSFYFFHYENIQHNIYQNLHLKLPIHAIMDDKLKDP